MCKKQRRRRTIDDKKAEVLKKPLDETNDVLEVKTPQRRQSLKRMKKTLKSLKRRKQNWMRTQKRVSLMK